jgi:hypothetical protein
VPTLEEHVAMEGGVGAPHEVAPECLDAEVVVELRPLLARERVGIGIGEALPREPDEGVS